jgi:YebC/PmpR family DNA-binding regulatory protein
MAGHSHSANIKHRKNAVDAKRGKIFSKLARHIISAARQGGADIDGNLKLKYAVEKARAANMPKDNIERAIKRGSGDKDGSDFEELVYEGYAPGGVALVVCCLTDNRNRTSPDVKHLFEKGGGSLGSTGSVAFQFDFRSIAVVDPKGRDEEAMTELALECGAEDLEYEAEGTTLYAPATEFLAFKTALEAAGLEMISAETGYVPKTTVPVAAKADAQRILKLIEALDENDDVQSVYANYDMDPAWMEELEA